MMLFHFAAGNSALHRIDGRFKLLALALLSITCLNGGFITLAVLSLLAAVSAAAAGGRRLLPSPRYVLLLCSLVLLVRGLTTPGEPIVGSFPLTVEGLTEGIRLGWRLLLLMSFGSLLAATTRASQIQDAARWILRPVPYVREGRIATMIGLVVRFIPLVLGEAGETLLAQRARCVENRKNPLPRIVALVLTVLRRSFVRAEGVAMAMEARCYGDGNESVIALRSTPRDWIYTALLAALCGTLIAAGV